jgi:thiol:disulfide interchange protein
VLVDFTANWCLTCQLNYAIAIDTSPVLELVKQNGVVPLLADWTDYSPEIKAMLNTLGSDSIPLLAIYPADRPGDPIILRDLLSQNEVLEALKQAGPSRETQNAKREPINEIKATSTGVPQSLNDHASATLFGGVGK